MRRLFFFLFVATAEALASYGVLFVPGSYSDVDPRQRGRTFEQQKQILDDAGIPWLDVPILSSRPYQDSVPILRRAIANSQWDTYYLVSFSMGGIIALDTFIQYPSTQRTLAGWIAYQSPFYGAGAIDRATGFFDLFDPFRIRRYYDYTGVQRVSAALSQEERAPYMRRYRGDVLELTQSRAVVCVTSERDEMVEARSAVLPGAREISVSDARHLDLTVGRTHSVHEDVFSDSFRGLLLENPRLSTCAEILAKIEG